MRRRPDTGPVAAGPTAPGDVERGLAFGLGAYAIWGLFPLYWKLLESQQADEILAHRIAWSLVFCLVVLAIGGRLRGLLRLSARDVRLLAVAALLISINWYVFIWATTHGHVVEASLGYFINPLVSVVLGVAVKRERLERAQWLAVTIATVGVVVLTVHVGRLPWVSLVLAASFGLYGLTKSSVRASALDGLTVETAVVALPAVAWLVHVGADNALVSGDPGLVALAIGAGPTTAIPLLLFAGAARRLPLATIGLLQYVTPTAQFLIGVFVLREPFDTGRLFGFVLIWIALVVFTVDRVHRLRTLRRARRAAAMRS